jgi:hypothetical protein
MLFTFTDGAILGLSLTTMVVVVIKSRLPFQKHSMNIFTHLMLLLTIFGLFGKQDFVSTILVRSLFFVTTINIRQLNT